MNLFPLKALSLSILFSILLLNSVPNTHASGLEYADLNNWDVVGGGTWQVQPGGRTVYQTVNGSKFYFLSDQEEAVNITIQGTIEVADGVGDNDFIGFTMGFEDTSNNIVFAWDKGGWGQSGYGKELWVMDGGSVTHLATDISVDSSKGWNHGVQYDFRILYMEDRIRVSIDGEQIFDVAGTFPAGRFGFFNESQGGVTYGNVQSAPGSLVEVVPVVEDDSYGIDANTQLVEDSASGIFANDYDPNLDTFTATVVDDVDNGTLNLNTTDGSFTYDPDESYLGTDTFTYKITDNDGDSEIATVSITVAEPNVAPTDIDLSEDTVAFQSAIGTDVGTLSTTDANTGETFDYSLINNGGGRFTVSGNTIKVANSELLTEGEYTIRVRSTDLRGLYIEEDFVITVGPDNQDPTDISLDNIQAIDDRAENETVIGDLSGTDPDEGDTLTFSLTDDAGGAFSIVDGQLVVANTNALTSPSQTVTVRATDESGATYDEEITINVTYVPPVIQDIEVETPDMGNPDQIRISWNKEDADTSHLDYGVNTTYGHSEEEVEDTADLDLLDCATYDYRIRLVKAGNTTTGNNHDMTTRGCVGDANVVTQNRNDVDKDAGGTVELMNNGKGTSISVPENFKTGETQAQFQVKKLETAPVIRAVSTPTNARMAGDHMYDLKALTDVTDQITEFDEPITVTMRYDESDVAGLIEETVRIHRWHDEQWGELENCTINTSINKITCQTSKFSVFGLFGTKQASTSSQRNGSGKAKTLRWSGMNRDDFLGTNVKIDKHNYDKYYAISKEQVARMNEGIAPKQQYMVNRWGEHVFAGYLAGRIGLERFPHRYQNIVRFGSGSLTKGRGIERQEEPLMLTSAPESIEDIIVKEPTNEGWADEYELAKDRFQRPEKSDDLFASAPVAEEKIALAQDQVETHKNQRDYYRKKGVPDRKRDTSGVRPSRMDTTKDMDTIKIRFGGKSTSVSNYLKGLQSSVIGNYDDSPETGSLGVLNSLGGIAVVILGFIGIELYRHRRKKKINTQ